VRVNPHSTERGISVRCCNDECEFLYRDISTGRVRVFSSLEAALGARDADVRYQGTLSAAFPSLKRKVNGSPRPVNRPQPARKKLRRTGLWDAGEERRLAELVDQLRPAGEHPIDFLWIARHMLTRDREQCRHHMARMIAEGRMPAFECKARVARTGAPANPRNVVKKTSRPRRTTVDPMQRRREQEDAMHPAPTPRSSSNAATKPKRTTTRMLMEEFGAAVDDSGAVFLDEVPPAPPPALSDLLGDETIASFFVDDEPTPPQPPKPAPPPNPAQPAPPPSPPPPAPPPVRIQSPPRSKAVGAKPSKEPAARRVATAIPRTTTKAAARALAHATRPIMKKTASGFRICMGSRAPVAIPGVAMQPRLTRDPSRPEVARPMFATSVRHGLGWDPFAFGNAGLNFKFVTTQQPERPRDALRLRAQQLMYRIVARGAPTAPTAPMLGPPHPPSTPMPTPMPPPSAPTLSSASANSASSSSTGCTP
jgi:hypothetical protein